MGIGTIKTLATVVFYSCFAAERAFSLSFGVCQAEDYLEAAILLQYK